MLKNFFIDERQKLFGDEFEMNFDVITEITRNNFLMELRKNKVYKMKNKLLNFCVGQGGGQDWRW